MTSEKYNVLTYNQRGIGGGGVGVVRGHENKNKNKTSQNSVFSVPSSAQRREQFDAPPNENSQYAYEIAYLLYMRIREGMRVYVRAYWETVPRLASDSRII